MKKSEHFLKLLLWAHENCYRFLFYCSELVGNVMESCNLTAFIHSSTGPVVHLFASRHEGPMFNPQGGYLCEIGILLLALSRYIGDPVVIDHCGLI
jgi:hypothetical protein